LNVILVFESDWNKLEELSHFKRFILRPILLKQLNIMKRVRGVITIVLKAGVLLFMYL